LTSQTTSLLIRLVYKDLTITNITGLVITVSGFTGTALSGVDVDDVVSTALETSIVQLPDEAAVVLIHATAVRVLEALSIPDQMKMAEDKAAAKDSRLQRNTCHHV
jgi:hypothetical protein